MEKTNVPTGERKNFKKGNKFSFNSDYVQNLPKHLVNLVVMVKNNAEIRRFVSLGIINILKQRSIVNKDAKCYVSFRWDKFSIKVDGFATEYSYRSDFFITAFLAAFVSFSAHAQKTAEEFIREEDCNVEMKQSDIESLSQEILNNKDNNVETEE